MKYNDFKIHYEKYTQHHTTKSPGFWSALCNNTIIMITRMVQLPATAAIEYVAACWVSGAGGLLPGGTFGRGLMPVPPKFNEYTHRLGFLCLAS